MTQPETAVDQTTPLAQPLSLTLSESKLIAAAADVEHAIVTFDWRLPRPDLALGRSYITPAADAMSGAEVHARLIDMGKHPSGPLSGSGYFGFQAYWAEKSRHTAPEATPGNISPSSVPPPPNWAEREPTASNQEHSFPEKYAFLEEVEFVPSNPYPLAGESPLFPEAFPPSNQPS